MWLIWELNARCCLQKQWKCFFCFCIGTKKLFPCEHEKLQSLWRQIMQPNAHSFGLIIVSPSVGYLMETTLKHASNDVFKCTNCCCSLIFYCYSSNPTWEIKPPKKIKKKSFQYYLFFFALLNHLNIRDFHNVRGRHSNRITKVWVED